MRMTNKSIQLLGFIPQPIELLVRKKSFTTPSGKKAPINWLRMDPRITPNKSTKKINEIELSKKVIYTQWIRKQILSNKY